jgi:hypothetical protein
MNKVLFGTIATVAALSASLAIACTSNGKDGFLPENDLYIPASKFATYTITEDAFDKANAKMLAVYQPFFKKQGRTLKIIADWADGTVNAYANQAAGNVSEVHMFGGLARHPKVTADGYMLVICHETGHHLGGAPRKGSSWASNEGQADYFATLKCAREVWKDEDSAAVVAAMEVPAIVTERCQKGFNTNEEIAVCKRAAMGGKSLADLLGDLGKSGDTDFSKPDPTVVTRMDDNHPDAQCRLDTYFAGSVCNKSKDIEPDPKDATVGACSQEKGEVLGIRPLCWYKPSTGGPGPQPTPTPTTPPKDDPGSSWPSARVKHRGSADFHF